ncbi:MAG TPA: dephospho-CoA kinase [Micropepsaceae bacterium]|jgi:dephospho-CoA kinase|nr:dephospho-CoA kinase [Micropepsaceae bacterium]
MAEQEGRKPFVVGLTGSIGMGKTETARLFARLGIPVHDADAVVHALYDRNGAAVAPIAAIFPQAVKDGRVDRTALAARLAGDEAAFQRLEAIVHPLVRQAERAFLDAAAARGNDLVVLDIPLLFETGSESRVDAVVVVSAPPDVQMARVLAREGMTPEKLEAIHARQIPDVDKRKRADFVIETDKGLAHAFEAVKRVVAQLRLRAAKKN